MMTTKIWSGHGLTGLTSSYGTANLEKFSHMCLRLYYYEMTEYLCVLIPGIQLYIYYANTNEGMDTKQ